MKLFKILAATAITFGASSVWADLIREDSTACSPTIHLKVPATWINAFISLGDTAIAFPKADANGWSTISLADKSITKNATKFFINNNSGRSCYKHACISPEGIYKSTISTTFTSLFRTTNPGLSETPLSKKTASLTKCTQIHLTLDGTSDATLTKKFQAAFSSTTKVTRIRKKLSA